MADGNHAHQGHSDDLLLLLQAKIQLTQLQQQFEDKQTPILIEQQTAILQPAMHRLKEYISISQGHYPNSELFQQSLENRAELLSSFAHLLQQYHQQIRHQLLPKTDVGQGSNPWNQQNISNNNNQRAFYAHHY